MTDLETLTLAYKKLNRDYVRTCDEIRVLEQRIKFNEDKEKSLVATLQALERKIKGCGCNKQHDAKVSGLLIK